MTSQDFKLSKIQIIIKDNDDEEEEEQGPKEVPMFDQTMSILTMIKDQKVIFNFLEFSIFRIFKFSNFDIPDFLWFFDDFLQEKERQQIKDEKIRQMALAQKAKMASKNETRLRLR